MKFNYDVAIPRSESEDINALYDFVDSEKQNMKITYETKNEAISRSSVLKRKAAKEDMPVMVSRIDCDVYVKRLPDGNM